MAGFGKLKAALGWLFNGPPSAAIPVADGRAVSTQRDAKENLIVTGDRNVVNVSVARDASQAEVLSPLHQLPADIADFCRPDETD